LIGINYNQEKVWGDTTVAFASQGRPSRNPAIEPIILDPLLLRAAQKIYRTYCAFHPHRGNRPYGIAIHTKSHRGQLIFRQNPVLLPGESFVSIKQLETQLY
jgi:hypothetical protein